LIKEAVKAVIGVGKRSGQFKITPLRVILFALLVALVFLGSVAFLLFIASVLV
tara:strand:- start:3210 stop:3368 length:159 start_codon:yes stop_codon:yes gene_type:complete